MAKVSQCFCRSQPPRLASFGKCWFRLVTIILPNLFQGTNFQARHKHPKTQFVFAAAIMAATAKGQQRSVGILPREPAISVVAVVNFKRAFNAAFLAMT